jgi:hypothetical protein
MHGNGPQKETRKRKKKDAGDITKWRMKLLL